MTATKVDLLEELVECVLQLLERELDEIYPPRPELRVLPGASAVEQRPVNDPRR